MRETEDSPGKPPRFEHLIGCVAIAVAGSWLVVAFFLPALTMRMGIRFWMPDDLSFAVPGVFVFSVASGIGLFVVWFYGFARKAVSLLTVLCSLVLLVAAATVILGVFSGAPGVDRHWFRCLASMCAFGVVQVACSWGLAFGVRRLLGRWLSAEPAHGGQGRTAG